MKQTYAVTYYELLALRDALKQLGQQVPTVAAFEIARNMLSCDKMIRDIEGVKEELQRRFGEKEEDGVTLRVIPIQGSENLREVVFTPENQARFIEEFNKLAAEQHSVELQVITRSQISGKEITPATLVPLLWHAVLVDDKEAS